VNRPKRSLCAAQSGSSAALSTAAIKATLVFLIFMHVRYSKPLIGLVVFGAVLWLAILIGLTMSDSMSRPWIPSPHGL
jgi:caa(3)-type oxidase subunit IV